MKVGSNFKFYEQLEFCTFLWVKRNGIFLHQALCVSTFALYAKELMKLTPAPSLFTSNIKKRGKRKSEKKLEWITQLNDGICWSEIVLFLCWRYSSLIINKFSKQIWPNFFDHSFHVSFMVDFWKTFYVNKLYQTKFIVKSMWYQPFSESIFQFFELQYI